jgi:hypothetical protein
MKDRTVRQPRTTDLPVGQASSRQCWAATRSSTIDSLGKENIVPRILRRGVQYVGQIQ